jgi:hypothetical protein
MNNKKVNSNNYIPNFAKKNNSIVNSNKASNGKTFINKFKSLNIKQILYIIAIIVVIILLIYIIISIVNYYQKNCYLKKSLFQYMTDFSDSDPCIQEKEPAIPKELPPKKDNQPITKMFEKTNKEVFHISNQDYTYDQAKCKCESYGGRLATKAEVTNAYNNGANWCTYGWTDKQSAFYPVQKCEWDIMTDKNKRLPDNEKKFCGMPGLNGGFFPNPQIKFGVNCFGIKPKGELEKAKEPSCEQNFCKMEQNYQASHKLDTDEIVGFNNEKWNAAA